MIWILFVILGALGGIASQLMHSQSFREFLSFKGFKSSALGGIAGIVYFFLYTDYNFPNGMMVFVSGYAAEDFIMSIAKKGKRQELGGKK